ncbi:MAG TPA: hypothetical protein DCM45_05030 [Clostridiales bacterium]|nr:hypothetical protein [Clostridiales bacterium]
MSMNDQQTEDFNLLDNSINDNWDIERVLLEKVRTGDSDISGIIKKAGITNNLYYDDKNLELHRLNIHILLTLVSRAAAEGGMPRKSAFSLCTEFRSKLNQCSSTNEITALSQEMLMEYILNVRQSKKPASCSVPIRKCCEYINRHLSEKLTLESLARLAGYTEFYLSRKFGQEMGCSMIDYIRDARIERAKYLLINSGKSIEDISTETGFSSRSYFTLIFHRQTGKTPTQFRRSETKIA